jgi:hypothetical protein
MRVTKGEGEVLHYYVSFFTPSTLVIQMHYCKTLPSKLCEDHGMASWLPLVWAGDLALYQLDVIEGKGLAIFLSAEPPTYSLLKNS